MGSTIPSISWAVAPRPVVGSRMVPHIQVIGMSAAGIPVPGAVGSSAAVAHIPVVDMRAVVRNLLVLAGPT